MNFTLWTIVWFAVTGTVSTWIGIAKVGPEAYLHWKKKEYSDVHSILHFIIRVTFWILLYNWFIK